MRVDQAMTKDVKVCRASDALNEAARLMWDNDCGCVPVVDKGGRAVGMLTDRDVCMAAYTRGTALRDIPVEQIMSRQVISCGPDSSIDVAEELMARHQIRRLAVVGFDEKLVGLLSLGDIARAARAKGNGHIRQRGLNAHAVEDTLAAVCQPRTPHAITP